MNIKAFYDPATFTLTYVVFDESTKDAVIIDPVLDYDSSSSKTSTKSTDEVVSYIKSLDLKLHYILETHAHADHLSSSQYLKEKFPNAKVAIGENIKKVQHVFKGVFNFDDKFATDGSQFDQLLKDDETFYAGKMAIKVINTPGHTPACVSFLINDALFTGDALFMPDQGTGRCDFPAGSAKDLYHSVQKIYQLPDSTRVFVGHDYQPDGREVKWESTIGKEKSGNVHLKANTSEKEYVDLRTGRDKTLDAPKLLLPSVQVNAQAGRFPKAEPNGMSYLKIPIR